MKYTGSSDFQLREEAVLKRMCQMKTGKWFIKLVLLVTIFVKFGGILTLLESPDRGKDITQYKALFHLAHSFENCLFS